jgi:hypothetical protein
MAAWWGLAKLERVLAVSLFGVSVPVRERRSDPSRSLFDRFVQHVKDPMTWKGLGFLFLKFPMGVLSFVVVITLLSVSLSLITAPLTYDLVYYEMWFFEIDSPSESAICMLLGVVIGIMSLHVINAVAMISGRLAVALLGEEWSDDSATQAE